MQVIPVETPHRPQSTAGVLSLTAASGVLGVLLLIPSALAAGQPPAPDAPTGDVINFLTDHRSALLWGAVAAGLSCIAFFVFISRLAGWFAHVAPTERPWITAMVMSWIALFTVYGLAGLPILTITWRGPSGIDPTLVRLAADIQSLGSFSFTACFAALSVIAPSVVIARQRLLPRWLLALAALEVAVNIGELAGITTTTGSNTAGYMYGLGPLVWAIWVFALATTTVRRTTVSAAASTTVAQS